MPMITEDMFETPYPVLKAHVVKWLDIAKELSEYWTGTTISEILDRQIENVDRAMYANQTLLAEAYLRELISTCVQARSEIRE